MTLHLAPHFLRRILRPGLLGFASLALAVCDGTEPVAPQATVRYLIDAPLCSSILPVEFFLDGVRVGTDTFVVGIFPEHLLSRDFETTSGQHVLGASVVGGFVWPDTVVTLAASVVFLDTLPFYCS